MSSSQLEAKERLLQAAIQEFALHGYDHGTVRRICGAADVNVNAVKYYFTDKRGLYVEAVKAAHRARHEAQKAIATHMLIPAGDDPEGDPEVRLKAFILQMVTTAVAAQDRPDYKHLLMFREMANPSEATHHIVQEFIRPHFDLLNQILARLLPPGTSDTDRQLLACSVVGQCMHFKMAGPILGMLVSEEDLAAFTAERISDHIFAVIQAFLQRKRQLDSA